MSNSLSLGFLQEKIGELRSALFYSQTDAVLKLPTSIISAFQVDETGQVWFFINKPSQYLQEFDRAFPAQLDFFKKGMEYYVRITGKAYIINDPEELNTLMTVSDEIRAKALDPRFALVKVRIMKADYYESYTSRNVRVWSRMFNKIYSLLFDNRHWQKPYSFQTDTVAA
jgi:general stress protein 26